MEADFVEFTSDYKVISAKTPTELVAAVKKELAKTTNEWEPLGAPFVGPVQVMNGAEQAIEIQYHQAMVIVDEEELK